MKARKVRSIGGDLVLVSRPGSTAAEKRQQQRRVYLSPDGARRLAVELLLAAEEADAKAKPRARTTAPAKRKRQKTTRRRRG